MVQHYGFILKQLTFIDSNSILSCFYKRGTNNEKNVSAVKTEKSECSRIQKTDVDKRRTEGACGQKEKGKKKADCFRVKHQTAPFQKQRHSSMKKQRTVVIKRKEEISLLLKNGDTWECSILKIHSLINNREYNRYAVWVPKKTGTAVTRNKIKRTAREFFKKNRGITPSHYDVLIRFHPKKFKLKTSTVESTLKEWYANTGT